MRTFCRCIALFCLCWIAQPGRGANADYYSPRISCQSSTGLQLTPIHAGGSPNGDVFLVNTYDQFVHSESASEVEWADFRYYYPDYMFKNRPQIAFVNDTIRFSEYFMVATPYGTIIGEA